MARGWDDVLEARVQLANVCRIALRDGIALDGEVERAVRKLARVMREAGALPEQMVIAVKDSLHMGGAGPAQTATYGEHVAKRAIVENFVTRAIDEFYASHVPVIPQDVDTSDDRNAQRERSKASANDIPSYPPRMSRSSRTASQK